MNSQIFSWVIIVSFYLSAIAHALWHIPVMNRMALEDWLVRGGVLSMLLAVATANLFSVLGMDSIWRRPWFALTGVLMLAGFLILLWKYRRTRATAALQPSIGVLPPRGMSG